MDKCNNIFIVCFIDRFYNNSDNNRNVFSPRCSIAINLHLYSNLKSQNKFEKYWVSSFIPVSIFSGF